MTAIESRRTPDGATVPGRALRARPVWPRPRLSRIAWLTAAFSAAAATLAPAQQIDPNVPTVIPEDELTNTIGILDRVLVDLLTPGTPPMLAAGMDLWRGLAIVLVVWTGLRIAYGGALGLHFGDLRLQGGNLSLQRGDLGLHNRKARFHGGELHLHFGKLHFQRCESRFQPGKLSFEPGELRCQFGDMCFEGSLTVFEPIHAAAQLHPHAGDQRRQRNAHAENSDQVRRHAADS